MTSMPNLASAKKNLRKSHKRLTANRAIRERINRLLKTKGADSSKIQSLIGKAAKTGVFHKNKAARLTAKLKNSK